MQVPKQVPREECYQIPRQACVQVPQQVCTDVPKQQCTDVPKQVKFFFSFMNRAIPDHFFRLFSVFTNDTMLTQINVKKYPVPGFKLMTFDHTFPPITTGPL